MIGSQSGKIEGMEGEENYNSSKTMNGFIIRDGNYLYSSSTDTGITENSFKLNGGS